MAAQQIALTDRCTGQGRLLGIADDVNGKALPDQFIGQCGVGDAADGQDHCVSGDLLVVFTGNDDRVVRDLLHRDPGVGRNERVLIVRAPAAPRRQIGTAA